MTTIHPAKFALQHQVISGVCSLKSFVRLASACSQELVGDVSYELQGDVDWENIPYLRLSFHAAIPLLCQRCMKPFNMAFENEVKLSPVFSDEAAKQLPPEYDPLVLAEDEVHVSDLIEDELLLLVPSTPVHALEDCSVKETSWKFGGNEELARKENPFEKLKNLKED